MFIGRVSAVIALVCAIVFAAAWPNRHIPAQFVAGAKSRGPLSAVQSWHYQLDKVSVEQLANTPADLLVIDYAKHQGKVPLTASDVTRIKAGPRGTGRYVVAYLSVGEAEEYRFYWDQAWKSTPPDWLGEENCAWPQAHRVRYWQSGWKEINFSGPEFISAQDYCRRVRRGLSRSRRYIRDL